MACVVTGDIVLKQLVQELAMMSVMLVIILMTGTLTWGWRPGANSRRSLIHCHFDMNIMFAMYSSPDQLAHVHGSAVPPRQAHRKSKRSWLVMKYISSGTPESFKTY
jgi:hypothetical protein